MPIFPIPFWPTASYSLGGYSFGNDRGDILHPACDLKAQHGTAVYAVEAGTVLPILERTTHTFFKSGKQVKVKGEWVCDEPKDPKNPTKEKCLWVHELRIKHANFIARYGEIALTLAPGVEWGKDVEEGQLIAYVGKQVVDEMLHFEMYSDVKDLSDLTVKHNMKYANLPQPRISYHRRKDLMNPTDYLDRCILLSMKEAADRIR